MLLLRTIYFRRWTYQFSVSKRIENPTLNYQFEGTKSILVCAGGTYDRGTYGGTRVRYNGARVARGVRTVANG